MTATTATREIVTDQREQFAFHDDIAYLKETKRGLTRATVEEISAFKEEPDWMLQYRLRAYDHFLKRAMPAWADGLDQINFRVPNALRGEVDLVVTADGVESNRVRLAFR